MKIEINAKKRDLQGTGASRRLRRAGRVPGILYGGSDAPVNLDMDHNELYQALRKEAFYSSVLTMNLDGTKTMCLLRDVQRHPYKLLVLHADFQRVDASQKIHQKVPLHFINADQCPAVKLQGGMVQHIATEIDVRCLPGDLPEFIEVDLKELEANHPLHVTGVKLPAGVEAVLHRGEDPVVATVVVRGGGAAAEEMAAPAETQITTEKKVAEKAPEKK